MKKKAIEKIPYFGLKKTSRKKDVKYIGVTAVKIVGHEKHLFLEVYRNKKESKETPLVRIVLTKKDFGTYWPEKEEWTRQKIKPDSCYGRVIWGEDYRFIGAYITKHVYAPSNKEIAEAVGISGTTVHRHLIDMIDEGILETDAEPGTQRAIRIRNTQVVKRRK